MSSYLIKFHKLVLNYIQEQFKLHAEKDIFSGGKACSESYLWLKVIFASLKYEYILIQQFRKDFVEYRSGWISCVTYFCKFLKTLKSVLWVLRDEPSVTNQNQHLL